MAWAQYQIIEKNELFASYLEPNDHEAVKAVEDGSSKKTVIVEPESESKRTFGSIINDNRLEIVNDKWLKKNDVVDFSSVLDYYVWRSH